MSMEKEFTFSIGDQVWLRHGNAAVCGRIEKLFYYRGVSCVDFTTVSENEQCSVSVDGRDVGSFKPEALFRTKEDLINSL